MMVMNPLAPIKETFFMAAQTGSNTMMSFMKAFLNFATELQQVLMDRKKHPLDTANITEAPTKSPSPFSTTMKPPGFK